MKINYDNYCSMLIEPFSFCDICYENLYSRLYSRDEYNYFFLYEQKCNKYINAYWYRFGSYCGISPRASQDHGASSIQKRTMLVHYEANNAHGRQFNRYVKDGGSWHRSCMHKFARWDVLTNYWLIDNGSILKHQITEPK